MEADKELGDEHLDIKRDDTFHSEDDMEVRIPNLSVVPN